MNLKELENKLKKIKDMGYVRTLRRGSTGIGYTFESLLGISENNLPIPDIGGRVEIKTVRKESQSLVTLFTFNKGVWQIPQKDLIKKYGYEDEKGRLALKNTVFYGRPIAQGLSLDVDENKNLIKLVDSHTGEVLGVWDLYVIVGKFMTKLSKILLVIADRKIIDGVEHFYYESAYLLSEPSPRKFIEAFKNSIVGIDIRMHLKENGAVRNRGTAFRIREKDLMELYENRRKIL